MKRALILFSFLLIYCSSNDATNGNVINLSENNNLDKWDYILEDTLISKDDIWRIEDGVLLCSGAVKGYIFTKEDYENYTFSFDWRWPQEAGNSGVLLHISSPDSIWPLCIEAQLKTQNAGDLIMMGGSTIAEQKDKTNRKVLKLNESNEKNAGEWNTYKIECNKDSIKIFINGALQNKASGASLTKGKIGLQSEGKPIEFKNIFLKTR